MMDFFPPRKRTVLLACLAVAVGWLAWSEVSAQSASDDAVAVDAAEIRSALNAEQKRHAAALSALQQARNALTAAKGDTAVIDGLIAAEKADHTRRENRLKAWLNSGSAQTDDESSRTRAIIDKELRDFEKAIGSLNQSIRIKPISSQTAQTGGTRFVDYVDEPDHPQENEDGSGEQSDPPPADQTAGSSSAAKPGPQAAADKPLGEALFREVPRDQNADQNENPTGIEQVQEQIQALSRQLAALQKQLDALKADQPAE